jgi:hypothetical protein
VGRSEDGSDAGDTYYSLLASSRITICGLYESEKRMTRKSKEFIHEGKYVAEVSVDLIEDDIAWSPYFSPDDALKLETVRLALRRGDVAEASKHGQVFELTPVGVK